MPNVGVIKSSWISASPANRLDAQFWLSVVETMNELGIDQATAGTAEVKRCIEHMDAKKAGLNAEAKGKRDEANKLLDEARDLEKRGEKIRPK